MKSTWERAHPFRSAPRINGTIPPVNLRKSITMTAVRTLARLLTLIPVAASLAACSTFFEPAGAPRKETVFAVTASNRLVSFNAGQPRKLLSDKRLSGLQPGETLIGIDYRVARGDLYGLGSTGRLYLIDTDKASASAVGSPLAVALEGSEFGFDFNPTVDRIRVVSDRGQNLRLHPDTGAVVDADPARDGVQVDGPLAYPDGSAVRIVSAAYTYNKRDPKITTNYAIDSQGWLVMQGSKEGTLPAVSPNTGQLTKVGSLGAGSFERAAFDISDVSDAAFVATQAGNGASRLHLVDLASGSATFIGTIGTGEPVLGIAIEP